MEKGLRIVKTITVLLIAILISAVSFGGVYLPQKGIWKNVIKDFNLGMEFDGYRELRYVLDDSEEQKDVYVDKDGNYMGTVKEDTSDSSENTENAETTESTDTQSENNIAKEAEVDKDYTIETRTIRANEQDDINIENFEKTKKIIQKRLETINLYEYNIRQDSVTGEIVVELPDDANIALEESLISTRGKLEIIDYQNGLLLLDNSHIKNATVLASAQDNQYQSYLQLQFDDEGKEILKKISNEYKELTSADGTTEKTYVSVNLDGQTLVSTYFAEEIDSGILQIPMGNATSDYAEYVEIAQNATRIAYMVNNDMMPLVYTLSSDNFIRPLITEEYIQIAKIISLIVVIAISLYLIIKYRLKGLYAVILDVAYIGLLLLIVRYANVLITLNAVVAFAICTLINYIFTIKILNKFKEGSNDKFILTSTLKELYLSIIPVCIIAVVFTFVSSAIISSIGMILFWGLVVQAICSLVVLI